jgi:ubiquinone/menaquinone biosynthesis C-methylase UbiE
MMEKEIRQYDSKELWSRLSLSGSNRERVEKTAEMIPSDVDSLADIGCGSGLFLNHIKKNQRVSSLVGVDFSENAMLTLTTSKKVGNITKIPLESNSYDMISALEVLEHLDLDEYSKAKEELARVSKKYILISVPFDEDLELEFVQCPYCRSRFNRSHHKRSFTTEDVEKLLEEQGYESVSIEYISKRNLYLLMTPLLNMFKKLGEKKELGNSVCPVCGYQARVSQKSKSFDNGKKKSSSPLPFLKSIWPKRYTYKWIACLYRKIN